jgi:polar amino acid transport system substrate-binding protein
MLPALLVALFAAAAAPAEEAPGKAVIVLHYYDRPPYMVPQPDGSATGLTADPAAAMFRRAGIPVRWQMTPAKRQLEAIRRGTGRDCGIGWFRDDDRLGYAAFFGPIYHDQPAVVLAGPGFAGDPAQPVEQQLQQAKSPILIKDGLTYGGYIARLIVDAKLGTTPVPVDQAQMVDMLIAGRAELMFSTREEADLLVVGQLAARKIRILDLAGDRDGEDRYVMCSRKLDPSLAEALRAALEG